MSATSTPLRGVRHTRAAELYHSDGYTWAIEQADALRRRDLDAIDWENVIEEIEDVGKAEVRSWRAFCARVIEHLLKIEYYHEATEKLLRHWSHEVREFRQNMARTIRDNPGLKGQYGTMFAAAWDDGRASACRRLAEHDESDTELPVSKNAFRYRDRTLPKECPYRLEDVTAFDPKLDRMPRYDTWPPAVARVLNTRLGTDYPLHRVRAQERDSG